MLETIKIIQQKIQGNKKELTVLEAEVNATEDRDEQEYIWDRINLLVGENRAYYMALSLIKKDLNEVTDSIIEWEPRFERA
tara:strand:+ start:478 stop:720 length:243 start_codon:yes stop_codon:yes gene_type:complete